MGHHLDRETDLPTLRDYPLAEQLGAEPAIRIRGGVDAALKGIKVDPIKHIVAGQLGPYDALRYREVKPPPLFDELLRV